MSEKLTEVELAAVEKRCEAATPGPWGSWSLTSQKYAISDTEDDMSNLVRHAEVELAAAGLVGPDAQYEGMVAEAVLELVRVFAKHGHSGYSASIVRKVFAKVAGFEPLCPLTGADDEWCEVGDGLFQNKRCSHVFKENGIAYDSEGRIFRDPDGTTWQNRDSRVAVTFPYTPSAEIVDRD